MDNEAATRQSRRNLKATLTGKRTDPLNARTDLVLRKVSREREHLDGPQFHLYRYDQKEGSGQQTFGR